jgi:hypothetical protein
MPWVRFDDQFPIHRKVDGMSDAAYRLHTSAIFWSARNLTDGFVSREDLDGVTARVRTPARFAAECVRRGVWHLAGQDCPSLKCPAPVDKPGWVIHDYWVYQPTKEQVVKEREAAAKRQAKWRAARNGAGQPRNAVSNGVSNAVSSPSPPRPERKRGGQAAPASSRASPDGPAGRADSRTPGEAAAAAGITPNGQPARGDTVHNIAAQAREAITKAQAQP